MELNQETQPLVTVITPLYNTEKYIAETIESVIKQTYQNWEMIIVDDCSTDNSRDIVKEYKSKDSRIKLIESETNFGGPARPRNIGIDNAKGEYIAFLDADDVWHNNKLGSQLQFMIVNSINFSSTNFIEFYHSNQSNIKKKNFIVKFINSFRKFSLCRLLRKNFIALSSVMIKSDVLINFSENKNFIAVEDYYLWLELFNRNYVRFSELNENLLFYRIVNGSISDRNIINKQDGKAKLCALHFINTYQRFELLNCICFSKVKNFLYSLVK